MRTQWPDIHPEIEPILIEVYRRMTLAEKLQHVAAINAAVKRLALAAIRRLHPDADEYECRLRLASLFVPTESMWKAFGWVSNQEDKDDVDMEAITRQVEARHRADLIARVLDAAE